MRRWFLSFYHESIGLSRCQSRTPRRYPDAESGKTRTRIVHVTIAPADASSPPLKLLAVCCLIHPKRNGPKKPPRFPTELMAAIPPAAARSRRNSDGIDQ